MGKQNIQSFINKVICWDSLSIMKLIPDKSIDLVLTDPPYWIGMNKKFGNGQNPKMIISGDDWDLEIPPKEYFDEIFRISKNQIIWGWNYFVKYLEWKMCRLVWDKNNGESTFSDGELARTSFDSALRIRKEHCTWWSMWYTEDTKGKVHPTQKPVNLMRRCLENYSEKWQTILDPFLWSWTTAVACKELGRNFIGIEKEQKYVDIANKRLATTTVSLFN